MRLAASTRPVMHSLDRKAEAAACAATAPGRAGRVIARAWALSAQNEREAARGNRDGSAGRGIDALLVHKQRLEVGVHDAEEDAHVCGAQILPPLVHGVQCGVAIFEEQPLLRVRCAALRGGHAEEGAGKGLGVCHEGAIPTGRRRVRAKPSIVAVGPGRPHRQRREAARNGRCYRPANVR